MNINYSIPETTIYKFSDKFNTVTRLTRYDKINPLFFFQNLARAISPRKIVITFKLFKLHVWLRITDDGSVLEMRI